MSPQFHVTCTRKRHNGPPAEDNAVRIRTLYCWVRDGHERHASNQFRCVCPHRKQDWFGDAGSPKLFDPLACISPLVPQAAKRSTMSGETSSEASCNPFLTTPSSRPCRVCARPLLRLHGIIHALGGVVLLHIGPDRNDLGR